MRHYVSFLALSVASASPVAAGPVVFSDAGASAADIQDTVDAYRTELGALNANLPQNFVGGRREINWDGVPDAFSDPNAFPGDFFNAGTPGRARGIVFTTPGSSLQTSSTAASGELTEFGLPDLFEAFSPERLFTAVGSNIIDVTFFDPAAPAVATTSTGLGVVFSDVDLDTTSMTFFNEEGGLLGNFGVPASGGDEGFSFLGVAFPDPVVARVRIVTGSATFDGSNFIGGDAVVTDDFIYGEPVAVAPIPLPAAAGLVLAAMGSLAAFRRRRQT